MKAIRKDLIIEKNQTETIAMERDVLFSIDHPFLVSMEFVFQSDVRIYFLLKFVSGGELFRHLTTVKRFSE
jgi:serine/threonine protein kinase